MRVAVESLAHDRADELQALRVDTGIAVGIHESVGAALQQPICKAFPFIGIKCGGAEMGGRNGDERPHAVGVCKCKCGAHGSAHRHSHHCGARYVAVVHHPHGVLHHRGVVVGIGRWRGIRLTMAARVVGDQPPAVAHQRGGSMQHVAPGGRQAMQQQDGRTLAAVIAVQRHSVALHREGRHAASISTSNRLSAWRSTNAGPTPFTSSSWSSLRGRRTAIDLSAASVHTV